MSSTRQEISGVRAVRTNAFSSKSSQLPQWLWGSDPPLARGGKLDRFLEWPTDAYIRSFAAIYVLYVDFHGPVDVAKVAKLINEMIPTIESLTLSLPPPDGPGSAGNEGVGAA